MTPAIPYPVIYATMTALLHRLNPWRELTVEEKRQAVKEGLHGRVARTKARLAYHRERYATVLLERNEELADLANQISQDELALQQATDRYNLHATGRTN